MGRISIVTDLADMEQALVALRAAIAEPVPTMSIACTLAGVTEAELELAHEASELRGSALLEDDECDDDRECDCGATMVHTYGPMRDPVTGHVEDGGYWECPYCEAVS